MNCFKFAPKGSLPEIVSQICKYLRDHPGWSEEDIIPLIKELVTNIQVESFNGRSGNVVLARDDVNNLRIPIAYFVEGNETIDGLDLDSLYESGIRFVFADWNSADSAYNTLYSLEYFSASNSVVYYPLYSNSSANYSPDNPPPYPVESVNAKTGVVELNLSDILGDSGAQVKLCTASEFTSNTIDTWNAYYNSGFRIVGVVNNSATAIDYLYLLKQDEDNHSPIGISTGASGAYSPTNPPPYPVTSVNGKNGAVEGLYDADNQPPYPVSSVNGKTGAVDGLYDGDNPPPYPVSSVNGKTGAVSGVEYVGTLAENTEIPLGASVFKFECGGSSLSAGNAATYNITFDDTSGLIPMAVGMDGGAFNIVTGVYKDSYNMLGVVFSYAQGVEGTSQEIPNVYIMFVCSKVARVVSLS